MLNQLLISIIVPIYMVERYLGICIESIINQTYKNLEIILVDDGSPDRCSEICDLYARKDHRIIVIHKPNGGLVSARKAGLAAATGTYVGYVDGDDWIEPNFYEQLYTAITANNADIVCTGQSRDLFNQCVCFYNPLSPGIYENEDLKFLYTNMLSYGEFYRPGITTYVWNKLVKRKLLFPVQMDVDERISIGEDAAVTYPLLMSCKKVCIINDSTYHYRQREDSMLKQTIAFNKERITLRYLYEYLIKFAKNQSDSNQYKLYKQITDYVLSICIMRSGGRLPSSLEGGTSYSTFNPLYYQKRIIIYSAGTFGQQLWNRFMETNHCKPVGWIDDDYREYRRCCLDVDPVETIKKTTFDFVLIATVDCHIADKIKKRLLDYGIAESKILTVECPESIRQSLLNQFLYE